VETVRVLAAVSLGQAAVAVALAFTHSVPLLVGLLFLLGAGATVVTPAVLAILPKVVGRDRTTPANASLEIARYAGATAGQIAAVALGGILVEAIGPRATLLLAGTGKSPATFAGGSGWNESEGWVHAALLTKQLVMMGDRTAR
jgi:MFS family permease